MGGILKHLAFEGGVAHTQLVGPPNPIVKKKINTITEKRPAERRRPADARRAEGRTKTSRCRSTSRGRAAAIRPRSRLAGQSFTLQAPASGASGSTRTSTSTSSSASTAWCTFYLDRRRQRAQALRVADQLPARRTAGADLRAASLAADLYKRLGPYRTLGWAEATSPLREERIDEKTFMDDLLPRVRRPRERHPRSARGQQLGPARRRHRVHRSRAAHDVPAASIRRIPLYDAELAAKFGDSIRARLPARGSVRRTGHRHRAEPGTTIMIVSDHGFHSWRKAVNLNTWLVEQGYMVLQGQARGQEARRPVRRRRVLRERGLEPHEGLRDGPRPDLLQPARTRGPGHRQPRRGIRARSPTNSAQAA